MFKRIRTATTTEAAARMRTPGLLWTDGLGRTAARSAQVLIILVLAVAVIFATIQLKLIVIPALIALILASALRPLVRFLERFMPRILAAVIALLAGVIVFGGIITIVVVSVQAQYDTLQKSVTSGIREIVRFVESGGLPVDQDQIDQAIAAGQDFLTSSQFGSGALAGVTTVFEIITGVVLGLFILFYFLKDGPVMWAFLTKPLAPRTHAKARHAGERAVATLGGYVRGTAIVAFFDAVIIGLGLFFLDVPLALPLAIVVFIGAFIPIVGATAAGIVSALVALVTNDVNTAVWVTVIVVVVNQLEGNVLSPVVLGRSLKLNGLVVLLALTAGTLLGGIVGTLLSVPLAAVAWTIIKSWNEPTAVVEGVDTPQWGRNREVSKQQQPGSSGAS